MGLPVLPCAAMRGNRDNCSYSTTTLFVALIRTYTPMHSVVSRLCFAVSLTLLCSPAVDKVGKPRWGHHLVEFVIVGKIGRKKKDWTSEAVPRTYGPWPGGLSAVTPVMAHGPEACEPSHPCGSR